MSKVIYKTIERFPGYRFGDDGSVWSQWHCLPRVGGRFQRGRVIGDWQPLLQSIHKTNRGSSYLSVSINDGIKPRKYLVHALILEAFYGPRPTPKSDCCHDNGNGHDNRLDNLRWDTKAANRADQFRHGTAPFGEKHKRSKLTDQQAREIFMLHRSGANQYALAAQYGISQSAVSLLVNRKNWQRTLGVSA
jgi:hypothetical protein